MCQKDTQLCLLDWIDQHYIRFLNRITLNSSSLIGAWEIWYLALQYVTDGSR